jgi:hypothetical protein
MAMGRSEKQLDPRSGPLARLAVDLRELRRQAGGPTYREMSKAAGYSPSALSAAASGAILPSATVLASYVRACGGDVDHWLRRRTETALAMHQESAQASVTAAAPDPSPAPRTARRPRLAHRVAGLLAAAIMGSLATVVPMAVWGAPSCLTGDHSHPAPAATCQPPADR